MSDDVEHALERARALLDFRRPDDARDEVRRGLATLPDDARLWAELARVERIREDHRAAVDAGHRALAIDPEQVTALDALVTSSAAVGQDADAKRYADRLVELRPDWARAHLQWAFVHTWWSPSDRRPRDLAAWPYSDIERCVRALGRATELGADQPGILADAARCAMALRRPDESRRLIEAALELAPTDEDVLLASARLADEATAAERSLSVLAVNPASRGAGEQLDALLWRRLSVTVLFVLVVATVTVLGIEVRAGAPSAPSAPIAWVVTAFAALSFSVTVRNAARKYRWRVWRRTFARDPQVAAAVLVSVLGIVVTVVASVVVLTRPPGSSEPAVGHAVAAVGVVVLLQTAALATVVVTRARVDVRAERFPDTPAGRLRLGWGDQWRRLAALPACTALGVWLFSAVLGTPGTAAVGRTLPTAWAAVFAACMCASEVLRRPHRRTRKPLVLWAVLGSAALVATALSVVAQLAVG
ncbi:tetratricopeptide repeat protein [Curtobacterium oceanosedimentum]|uniref:tetratricopeptide repeat protein n=1 Tax=Curtobacterium oceanosedimentum TaxID=465820 RepID=UPI001CE1993D|nr:tetratricopeptide repeat protein [Curtobacterium oceanosedimentum]MCA5922904.1 tetratricopeptide repeat protein [Curtobacterium oceanosedimentum]